MSDQSGQGKKKKEKVKVNVPFGLDWADVDAEEVCPARPAWVHTSTAPKTVEKIRTAMPSAPSATGGRQIDENDVPLHPPFRATLRGVPYTVSVKEVKDLLLQINTLDIDMTSAPKGYVKVEFSSRQDLMEGLKRSGEKCGSRRCDITVDKNVPRGNQFGGQGGYGSQGTFGRQNGGFQQDQRGGGGYQDQRGGDYSNFGGGQRRQESQLPGYGNRRSQDQSYQGQSSAPGRPSLNLNKPPPQRLIESKSVDPTPLDEELPPNHPSRNLQRTVSDAGQLEVINERRSQPVDYQERKRLQLKPPPVSRANSSVPTTPGPADTQQAASIFGGAVPVDTYEREQGITAELAARHSRASVSSAGGVRSRRTSEESRGGEQQQVSPPAAAPAEEPVAQGAPPPARRERTKLKLIPAVTMPVEAADPVAEEVPPQQRAPKERTKLNMMPAPKPRELPVEINVPAVLRERQQSESGQSDAQSSEQNRNGNRTPPQQFSRASPEFKEPAPVQRDQFTRGGRGSRGGYTGGRSQEMNRPNSASDQRGGRQRGGHQENRDFREERNRGGHQENRDYRVERPRGGHQDNRDFREERRGGYQGGQGGVQRHSRAEGERDQERPGSGGGRRSVPVPAPQKEEKPQQQNRFELLRQLDNDQMTDEAESLPPSQRASLAEPPQPEVTPEQPPAHADNDGWEVAKPKNKKKGRR